jgi:Ubiquitin family
MATITISVQSILNFGEFDSYTVSDGITVATLKNTINAATGTDSSWYNLNFNEQVLVNANTLASYGITNGSVLGTGNVIARLPTLQDRQLAKLDLAALDRTAAGNPWDVYDITELPSQYIGNVSTPNPHPTGLIEGRPWAP